MYSLRKSTRDDAYFLFKVMQLAMLPTIKKSNPNYKLNLEEAFEKYISPFKPEEVDVIVFNGVDIGRLRLVKTNVEIYIGGFQILPGYQNKGIGTKVLHDLIEESLLLNIPVKLEVQKVNFKAKRFYEKNDFNEAGMTEKDFIMEFSPFKYKKEVEKLIDDFCNSFDDKDWNLMSNYLNIELAIDYESFRGTPKRKMTSKEYMEKRIIGLKGLRTVHKTEDYKFTKIKGGLKCVCNFKIKRYEQNTGNYLHSYGEYEFGIKGKLKGLKIYTIKQIVKKTVGNKSIHGASK